MFCVNHLVVFTSLTFGEFVDVLVEFLEVLSLLGKFFLEGQEPV